jgi:branched-chain amino acid transport system substrate-binding protein
MASAAFNSPRGPFKLSAAHNPVQNFYLREFKDGANRFKRNAVPALADPGTGCRLGA